MTTRGKKAVNPNDPARFSGNGLSYRAKLIGIETVPEARGDEMCQETITKLKNSVRISGQHKPKIFVQVTLEGLKIIDAISLIVLHSHAVHKISFIARDVTDNRAFGYVYGEEDGTHKFFAIKTAGAAEQLVLALRDLFQVVYEMKKKEMEKTEQGNNATADGASKEENSQPSGDGSTLGTGQDPAEKAIAEGENIYQVPTNNAPVNPPTQAEQVANLLDLEDQAEHILKDIEQIKNLEFDSLSSNSLFSQASASPPTAEMAKLATPSSAGIASLVDPWGLSASVPSTASPSAATSTSALGDLAGLQTGPFSPLGQSSFTSLPFSVQPGMLSAPHLHTMGSGGLPVNRDPFGNDPFSGSSQQRLQSNPGFTSSTNPFGATGFGAPFGMPQIASPSMTPGIMPGIPSAANTSMTPGLMPGMVPHGFISSQPGMMGNSIPPMAMGGVRNPFAPSMFSSPQPQMGNLFGEEEPNVLKPMNKDGSAEGQNPESQAKPKATRDDLFGDLLDIKKSTPAVAATMSPKDLFSQAAPVEKKSLNELKSKPAQVVAPQVQASDSFDCQLPEQFPLVFNASLCSDQEESSASFYGPPAMDPPSFPNQCHSHSFMAPPIPQRRPPSPNANIENNFCYENKQTSPLNSPPIPSRTFAKSKVIQDSSTSPTFSVLRLNIKNEALNKTNDSLVLELPSPDEPPPPLPLHLNPPLTAPAPPPRPVVSSSSFTSSLSSIVNDTSSFDESNLRDRASQLADQSGNLALKYNGATNNDSSVSDIHKCDIQPSNLSIDISEKIVHNGEINNEWEPFSVTFSLGEEVASFLEAKDFSDPFINKTKENSPKMEPDSNHHTVTENESSDPFSTPLHLMPGFKVVAKFGSDPFDDSFNNFKNDRWDPFGSDQDFCFEKSDLNLPPSAFDPFSAEPQSGDSIPLPAFNAFGVPTQPFNGATGGNSLLD